MALLFPTAFVFYVGVKMVFAAYRDYKRWREAWQQEIRKEGRDAERERIRQQLQKHGISAPEIERILSGESDDNRS